MKKYLLLLIGFSWFNLIAQKVETVVSAGFDITTMSIFSENNKYLALAANQYVIVYEVKSGRMIRRVDMPKGIMLEKLTFNKNEIGYYVYAKDQILSIDIETGVITDKKRASWDLATYNYQVMNEQDWLKASTHFHTNKSNNPYEFKNGKKIIRYGIASRSDNQVRYFLEVINDGKKTVLEKDAPNIVFMNAVYSKNGRFGFASGYIFDFQRNEVITQLKSVPFSGMSADFKPNTNIPVVLAQFGLFTEWDMPQINKWEVTGAVEMSFNGELTGIKHYNLDSKSYGYSSTTYGMPLNDAQIDLGDYYFHSFSQNHQFVLVKHLREADKWKVVDMNSKKVLKEIEGLDYKSALGWNGNNLWINKGETLTHVKIPEMTEVNLSLQHHNGIEDQYTSMPLYDNGVLLKFDFMNRKTSVWDTETGNRIAQFELDMKDSYFGWKMKVDRDLMKGFVAKDNDVNEYDLRTGKILHSFKGHSAIVTQIEYSSDKSQLITSSTDGTAKIWDIKTGQELLAIILVGKEDYILKTPDNYYLSTRDATDYIHFVKGKDIYLFEQFDLKFNRPDIVLSKLNYVDPKLIQAYKKAYLKRLKKMNFTEEMLKGDFHLPKVKIKNFEYLPMITDSAKIELNLHIEDEKYPLDRVNIWINDVAIFGTAGISVRELKTQNLDKSVSFELAKGVNKVQVSVLNQAGAESYKETYQVKCNAGKERSDLYLITIGESKFKNEKYNLTYAAKDAKDLVSLFNESKQFKNVFVKTLVNEETTKENILNIRDFIKGAGRNDQVLLFIAGHGVLNEELDYFLATYDMDFENPTEKGLPYEELEAILDGIQPLKKTLIMDACHSGEIDKEEVSLISNVETETEDITFRAVGNAAAPKLGSENVSELTNTLFSDLRRGTGATVISSAGGVEFAMESDEWKNGLFTYCMISGIKNGSADLNNDGEIWLSELQKFVQEEVAKKSNGKQKPTTRKINLSLDYRVW